MKIYKCGFLLILITIFLTIVLCTSSVECVDFNITMECTNNGMLSKTKSIYISYPVIQKVNKSINTFLCNTFCVDTNFLRNRMQVVDNCITITLYAVMLCLSFGEMLTVLFIMDFFIYYQQYIPLYCQTENGILITNEI